MTTISTKEFIKSLSPDTWKFVLSKYAEIPQKKAASKTKPEARKELIKLDNWYQNDLPTIINGRVEKYVTKEELEKLVRWKITRGKFRPTLPSLVASNSPDAVIDATKKAFKKLPDIKSALDCACVLRGIGPATASAVLAAGAGDMVAFMADESVLAFSQISVLKYDVRTYLQFNEAIIEVTNQLQKLDPDFNWTAHKVEKTLWAHSVATSLHPSILSDVTNKPDNVTNKTEVNKNSKKRKNNSTDTGRKKKISC